MTVGELIQELQRVDPTYEAVVVVQTFERKPISRRPVEHEAPVREIVMMVERRDPARNGAAFIIGGERSDNEEE